MTTSHKVFTTMRLLEREAVTMQRQQGEKRKSELLTNSGTTTDRISFQRNRTFFGLGSTSSSMDEESVHEIDRFLEQVHGILMKDVIAASRHPDGKVVEYRDPKELARILDLSLRHEPVGTNELLGLIQNTIKYSVKVGNPRFINQLYSGLDPFGLAGEWVIETLNPSLYTFEVSPVFVLVETAIIREMCKIVGFPADSCDGLFAPGGSVSSIYGVSIARFWKCPLVKQRGLSGMPRLVAFRSEFAHYCIEKACVLLGIGKDNLIDVKCDADCRMMPSDLEAKILQAKAEGAVPFLVVATEGTTVHGAFDPLVPIADICQRHGCWLHADAAWGGSLLLSKRYRSLMNGIERADSVVWNPHKMLGAPQQCSAFMTRHRTILQEAHAAKANYLFQTDKFYDSAFDPGDKTLQCGRKVDSYKFFLMWKAKGTDGLTAHVDRLMELAQEFTNMICQRDGFMLVKRPSCTNVCFWYVPPSLRTEENIKRLQAVINEPPANYNFENGQVELDNDAAFWMQLDKVAAKIKERMVKRGSMMITYTREGARANFFRLVLQSAAVSEEHLQFFVDEIESLGIDL